MKIKNIKEFLQKKIKSDVGFLYVLSGVVFLIALGLLVWFVGNYVYNYYYEDSDISSPSDIVKKEKNEDCEFPRFLDGVCVADAQEQNPQLIAVMIENHTEARPQSGLVDASVVYEAPVEANYSRFLAIYPVDTEVEKAGPVRSARPYYLDWVSEYGDPMYMHVGGSPEALRLIKQYDFFDINEMTKGWYFWRSTDRYAPHNTFTSSKLWGDAWDKLGSDDKNKKTESEIAWWNFLTSAEYLDMQNLGETASSTFVDEIKVSFLSPVYEAIWQFNTSTGKYDRFQMEGAHRDLDGRKIKADTVVVQHVRSKVLDSIGRIAIDTIGEGEVEVYYDGMVFTGTWKKPDRTTRTRFFDESGKEIKLKPGKIWIEVINR